MFYFYNLDKPRLQQLILLLRDITPLLILLQQIPMGKITIVLMNRSEDLQPFIYNWLLISIFFILFFKFIFVYRQPPPANYSYP